MIVDATDLVVGRMSSFVAKKAMLGEKIDIVNCEKAVISGKKEVVMAKFLQKTHRATIRRGPFVSRMPDRFIRRIIRGMLPYKFEKGEKAFKRVMCYIGVPKEFDGKKFETVDNANIHKRQLTRYMRVSDLCSQLGGRYE